MATSRGTLIFSASIFSVSFDYPCGFGFFLCSRPPDLCLSLLISTSFHYPGNEEPGTLGTLPPFKKRLCILSSPSLSLHRRYASGNAPPHDATPSRKRVFSCRCFPSAAPGPFATVDVLGLTGPFSPAGATVTPGFFPFQLDFNTNGGLYPTNCIQPHPPRITFGGVFFLGTMVHVWVFRPFPAAFPLSLAVQVIAFFWFGPRGGIGSLAFQPPFLFASARAPPIRPSLLSFSAAGTFTGLLLSFWPFDHFFLRRKTVGRGSPVPSFLASTSPPPPLESQHDIAFAV